MSGSESTKRLPAHFRNKISLRMNTTRATASQPSERKRIKADTNSVDSRYMEYSDVLAFDSDINTEFIIIQSCLSDLRHAHFLQNCDNITLIDDHLTFSLGDSFESFDDLKLRLDAHSKHSNIHYWMRDTRTVAGARKRTTRRIEARLKYYNVKYACVYGGYKFFRRGKGLRNVSTLKSTDCPAHVALRADRSGECLTVTSVCNHHNHDVSPDVSGRLRQGRKLSHELREEVLDLLRMRVSKHMVLAYARRGNQHFQYKDVINLMRMLRGKPLPELQRRLQLMEALNKIDIENKKMKAVTIADIDVDKPALEPKRRRRKTIKRRSDSKIIEKSEKIKKILEPGVSEVIACQSTLDVSEFVVVSRPDVSCDMKSCAQSTKPEISDSKIMEYLYTDFEGDHVFAVLNQGDTVTLENETNEKTLQENSTSDGSLFAIDPQQVVIEDDPYKAENHLNENAVVVQDQAGNYTQDPSTYCEPVFAISSEGNERMELNGEDRINQIVADKQYLELSQDDTEETTNEEIQVMPPEEMHISSESQGDIILEESWTDDATYHSADIPSTQRDIVNFECSPRENVELDLNAEVNALKLEKEELLVNTELLRKERDKLLQEIRSLKDEESTRNNLTDR